MREVVFQGTRQAVSDPHFVADHAAAVFDELGEGTHCGLWGLQRLQLVAMGEQQCELEFSVCGVIFGPAGREGFAIPRQRQGIDGKEDEEVVFAQGGDDGAFVEFETHGHGLAGEPRACVGTHASMASGVCSSCESQVLEPAVWKHTSCLASAQSIPIRPQSFVCSMRHVSSPRCAECEQGHASCVLRKHYREPVARQTLSIR